jgi:hypothetical protein
MKPQIYIDGISDLSDDSKRRVTLIVLHEGKEFRIGLPAGVPRDDQQQPGAEVYRNELLELMDALDQWANAHEGISWQRPSAAEPL